LSHLHSSPPPRPLPLFYLTLLHPQEKSKSPHQSSLSLHPSTKSKTHHAPSHLNPTSPPQPINKEQQNKHLHPNKPYKPFERITAQRHLTYRHITARRHSKHAPHLAADLIATGRSSTAGP
jgi:hypothetical protein